MRKYFLLIAGVSAAFAIYLASRHGEGGDAAKRMLKGKTSPVGELAHQLQDAWADHHTTV